MSEANKAVVRRLVDEVLNGGHLEVIDALYASELAAAAKRWVAPFRARFGDLAASATAGLLWTAGSAEIAFAHLTGWMALSLIALAAAGVPVAARP